MFDIFIGDQLAAIVASGLVKIVVNALIEKLPNEFSITVRAHAEPSLNQGAVQEAPKAEEAKDIKK